MGILMMGGQPIIILKEGTEREKGKGAVTNNIAAARAVADAVKSTLGPKGMDKMLVDSLGDVTITNDGVTILKEIEIEHPTAKMLVEVAKTQDDEVGDGTTSAVILAGELLKEAEDLIEQEVHQPAISPANINNLRCSWQPKTMNKRKGRRRRRLCPTHLLRLFRSVDIFPMVFVLGHVAKLEHIYLTT